MLHARNQPCRSYWSVKDEIEVSRQAAHAASLSYYSNEAFSRDPSRNVRVPSESLGYQLMGAPYDNFASSVTNRQELAYLSGLAQPLSTTLFPSFLRTMSLDPHRSYRGSIGTQFSSPQWQSLAYSPEAFQSAQMQAFLENYSLNAHPVGRTNQQVIASESNHLVESARLLKALEALRQQRFLHNELTPSPSLLSLSETRQFVFPQNIAADLAYQNQACRTKTRGETWVLAMPEDHGKLNEQQIFLRQQIEIFRASHDDIMSHTRGRNKAVVMGQVGIRCRHCGHLPVVHRRKGSTYFPSTLISIYQAAQNVNTEHMQSGVCQEIPVEIQSQFLAYGEKRAAVSGAGKPYWAEAARKLGLIDTEEGIRFAMDITSWPPHQGFGMNRI